MTIKQLIKTVLFVSLLACISITSNAKHISTPKVTNDYGLTQESITKYSAKLNKKAGIKSTDSDKTIVKKIMKFERKMMSYEKNCNMTNVLKNLANGKKIKGNCNTYSQVFYIMCAYNDIPCRIRTGNVKGKGNSYHAWNIVKYNGKWYWLDVTWNDQRRGLMYNPTRTLWKNHMRRTGKVYAERWVYIDENGLYHKCVVVNGNQRTYNNLDTNIFIKYKGETYYELRGWYKFGKDKTTKATTETKPTTEATTEKIVEPTT